MYVTLNDMCVVAFHNVYIALHNMHVVQCECIPPDVYINLHNMYINLFIVHMCHDCAFMALSNMDIMLKTDIYIYIYGYM